MVDAIPLTEIPFMVLTLVLVRDARVELEKWREEGVRGIAGRGSERRRRNQTGHLLQWNQCCRTVIKENGVRQIIRQRGCCLWKRYIHNCARQEHLRDGVEAFKAGARRIFFFKMGIVVTEEIDKQTIDG